MTRLVRRLRELLDKHPGTCWFPVPPEAMAYGDNRLELTLKKGDPDAGGEIVIDEVEVWVQPK